MPASVSFEHVNKTFGDVHAVRDLTMEIDEGEFLVLVGPSGCGKTTALRMVAGLEELTSGSIRIADEVVNGREPRDRDIAMVFQSYALYPHMSVFDNLAFGLRQRKTPGDEIRRRVADTAAMLGLEELLGRKPRQLSGGQRQRVALGRAIVRRPNVFLMDEPLSNLDAHLRLRTRGEIVTLQRQLQTTVIYVTHDQVEAMTMGTRIAVLDQGVLQQVDTPQHLYDHPANVFVATFIGSPAMNLFTGEVTAADDGLAFAATGMRFPLAPGLAPGGHTGSVILGFRPEHLRLTATDDPLGVPGEVTLLEPLGSDLFVSVRVAGHEGTVVARLAPETVVRVGDRIALTPDLSKAHIFAADTGARL